MDSENLKAHSKILKPNRLLTPDKEENSNLKSDKLNMDDDYLKDKITPYKKPTTVKFKEPEANEAEPILNKNNDYNKNDDNFSNAEKIKDILNKAKIMNANSENNSDLRSSPVKNIFKSTPPRTPEKEQVFNMIEIGNQPEAMMNNYNNNIYESPNMIRDSLKINSNIKNQPNAIEFNHDKNISNTTFRAGSEVNKNK